MIIYIQEVSIDTSVQSGTASVLHSVIYCAAALFKKFTFLLHDGSLFFTFSVTS